MSVIDKLSEKKFDLKIKANGYYRDISVVVDGSKLQLHFPYNVDLLAEVKENFSGRQFVPKDKGGPYWTIPISHRNIFRLDVLQGKYSDTKPYQQFENVEKYDLTDVIKPLFEAKKARPYKHSMAMVSQALIARSFIWGADMGLGKSLAAIIAMEMFEEKYGWAKDGILWVAPKSALVAGKLEFSKWRSLLKPTFHTYDGMRDLVENWISGRPAPRMVIFDEGSRLKNPITKRSQAAAYIATKMREEYGFDCMLGILSGTPAPKNPSDWWMLCEIGCPGFIREGHVMSFRNRLALIEKRETVPGAGGYDHIVTWRDDEKKCHFCGMPEGHVNHQKGGMDRFMASLGHEPGRPGAGQTHEIHDFKASVNEVVNLNRRMRGLVGVWLTEDCTDLPPIRYEVITVKPNRATLNAAKIIAQTAGRAVEALTLLRELSDGFQYIEVKTGNKIECRACSGSGKIIEYYNPEHPHLTFSKEEVEQGVRFIFEESDYGEVTRIGQEPCEILQYSIPCKKCSESGTVDEMTREISEVDCPKDQILIDLLEEHEEYDRFNIYAGFTGSIDRVSRITKQRGWGVIRVDGRGWSGFNPNGSKITHPNGDSLSPEQLMLLYSGKWTEPYSGWLSFLGQPGAAGMGLTLTASPSTFFFSNDFNGENRMQAEKRGHRLGMDVVRGGRVIDVIHLQSDLQVLDNLKKKKDLQYLTMKGLAAILQGEE